VNKVKILLIQTIGLNREPLISISFLWYIFNVYINIKYALLLMGENAKSFNGFGSFSAYVAYSIFFTFIPHLLCMEKGKHDFFGVKILNDLIVLVPVFAMHYALSGVVLGRW
jgi:hypothetical protein